MEVETAQNKYSEKFKPGDKVLGFRTGNDGKGKRMEPGWTVTEITPLGITLTPPGETRTARASERQVYKWNTPLKVGTTEFMFKGSKYLVTNDNNESNLSAREIRLRPDPLWLGEGQTISYLELMGDREWIMLPLEIEDKKVGLPDDSLFRPDSIMPDAGVETKAELLEVETQTCIIPKSDLKPSEDALVSLDHGIAVCDGVGGEINSANAAEIAVDLARNQIRFIEDTKTAESVITMIDNELVKKGQKGRLCTTVTIGRILRNGDGNLELIYANSGDSGIIIYRGDKVILLTRDQSPLWIELPKEQALKEQYRFAEVENPDDLSVEDRKIWDRRHEVTRIPGERGRAQDGTFSKMTTLIETGRFKVQEGDIIEFATDGLKDVRAISRRKKIVDSFGRGEITDLATALANDAYQENIRLKEEAQRLYNSRAYISLVGVSPILDTNEISNDYIERDINQVNKMLKGTRYKPDDIGVGIKIIRKKKAKSLV